MLNLETFGTRDGFGDYLWDRVLWLLAPGAVVFLVGFAFALKHFTPPPQDGGRAQQRISTPPQHGAHGDHGAATPDAPGAPGAHDGHDHGAHDGHAH